MKQLDYGTNQDIKLLESYIEALEKKIEELEQEIITLKEQDGNN